MKIEVYDHASGKLLGTFHCARFEVTNGYAIITLGENDRVDFSLKWADVVIIPDD